MFQESASPAAELLEVHTCLNLNSMMLQILRGSFSPALPIGDSVISLGTAACLSGKCRHDASNDTKITPHLHPEVMGMNARAKSMPNTCAQDYRKKGRDRMTWARKLRNSERLEAQH